MTSLLYLSDTYQFSGTGTIQESGENEHGKYIVLDQTIFYPQGGGQPSDVGVISNAQGSFSVRSVRIDETGTVYHYGEISLGMISIGEEMECTIDKERRILNARNHSAGHLIDVAMKNLRLGNLLPIKGYHFAEGCYVEYSGGLGEETLALIGKLEEELARLIEKNIGVVVSYSENTRVIAPNGKLPRYVNYEGYSGCGCGGTHIRSSGEIGSIQIRKIKGKDGMIRVSYSVGEK